MLTRLRAEIAWFSRTITPGEQRFVRWLGWASTIVVLGLTATGAYQFLNHEPDPDWFRYARGSELSLPSKPSTGAAELHGLFGDAAFAIALFGGAWFAYKILFRVPKFAAFACLITLAANITGSIVRFNAVKTEGRSLEQADDGYVQIFTDDIEFVVNARQELESTAIRLFTLGHVASVPVLLVVGWFTVTRAREGRRRDLGATADPTPA